MKEKTGLISPQNGFIDIEYYDIYDFAKRRCLEYASKSEENNNIFNNFSKEYETFNPYIDFLICNLDYAIVNPLNYHNVIEYCDKDNGELIFKEVKDITKPLESLRNEQAKTSRIHEKCSDTLLNIREFSKDIKDDGIILPNGKFLTLDRKINPLHENIARGVINQYLARDKILYYDYLKHVIAYYKNKDITLDRVYLMYDAIEYLTKFLGCIDFIDYDTYGQYIYNGSLLTKNTSNIIKESNRNSKNKYIDVTDSTRHCYITLSGNVNLGKSDIKKYQKIINRIFKEKV